MKLSEAQIDLLRNTPFVGPLPGSNLLSFLQLDVPSSPDCDDVSLLVRRGFLTSRIEDADRKMVVLPSDGWDGLPDIECTHVYEITPAGRQALANAGERTDG